MDLIKATNWTPQQLAGMTPAQTLPFIYESVGKVASIGEAKARKAELGEQRRDKCRELLEAYNHGV